LSTPTCSSTPKTFGLAAADALHVAAAKDAGVEEFITAEKTTSPLFRVIGISITSIRS
jgi:predicted nucleic acid-binding protein